MNKRTLILSAVTFTIFVVGLTIGFAAEPNLPVVKGKKVVATVNGEPVTFEEYDRELLSLPAATAREKEDLLKRLINARLIIQEGKRSGLAELPEIKQRVDVFSKVTLRDELMARHVRNIKPDPKEVEKLYKDSVKEVKLTSVLFEKEDGAKKFEKAMKEGNNFDGTIQKFLSDGTAKEKEAGNYFKVKDLTPEIAGAVRKMKTGELSAIVHQKSGFVISRLEDIRYTESAEAKEWARQESLKNKQKDTLVRYEEELKKKYSKVNQKILDSLNIESKEKFEKLLKDQRVVAEIQGEKPITVGELVEYMRQQLYHGTERAIEGKRLDKRKVRGLEEMIHKRVFIKEALRLGVDKTDGYRSKVREHGDSLVFGAYVQKAVVPEVKLQEKEFESYYNDHVADYTYPEMAKIESLIFKSRKDAEAAIEKLRKGVELKWLADNAEGQVDKNAQGVMSFKGKLLTVKDLPESFQKAVAGTRSGDSRLYESPEGHFYVLAIEEVVASKPQPYQEVKGEIAKKVYSEKIKKAVEDLSGKLRVLSDVKIYLKN